MLPLHPLLRKGLEEEEEREKRAKEVMEMREKEREKRDKEEKEKREKEGRDRKESVEAEEKKGIGVTNGCDFSSSSADNEEAPRRPEGTEGAYCVGTRKCI